MDPLTTAGVIAGVAALSPLANRLLTKALGPVADAVGDHFGEKMSRYLERNRIAVANRAAEMVEASRREVYEIPLRTALPLLEGASREDDRTLQELWAALLANAMTARSANDIPALYPRILQNLTPLSAVVLQTINRHTHPTLYRPRPDTVSFLAGFSTVNRAVSVTEITRLVTGNDVVDTTVDRTLEFDTISPAIDLLVSQGLVDRDWVRADEPGSSMQDEAAVVITDLGRRFVNAVTVPGT